ncbi:MAG: hypothetical protein A3A98_01215 [Candidatus Staskawiczbacteria bacterium RIFCSPLOWO2_01_FULL_40_39]|uniref:Methyltransferase type 11 domain-containing protein n=1 Tax=Candidatus Staskawiczbacteria bacterium RIFCSPHIGHO2_01_FULL_39_25 TaxID=1802202 RepID=A0A1G2HNB9_9BACT|nr:MAG: hypothetical protein A2730_01215 [Candidatus Staskawiczbacteria bacterium RIFCSPHIGHO2_01_FULL_39_25]OGZ73347.1 MAG: hypothetical protein A3A98_01215 [Candidatus Staskawiczbacteria bacterium RIFCSPLOWO2_01_FULL_40_39]OGZ76843.1 MAG: hypothetical protein A3I87_01860 [Candidatus Staskawiczbacteria bacterium RIFCSPLOWO2_02_FULL_39_8]
MKKRQAELTYRKVKQIDKFTKQLLKNKQLQPAFYITLLQLQKDTNAALSFWNSVRNNKTQKNKPEVASSDKLQIGGGKRYMHGFVNLDIFPPADIIWDSRYGLPFQKDTFSFIFSEHFLEHLDFPISVNCVLQEIYRILKPSGKVVIGVPDGGKVIKAYGERNKKFLHKLRQQAYNRRQLPIETYSDIDLVNYLFRDQLENPNYTIHYWAYDKNSLENILRSVGFKKVEKYPFNPLYCNPKRKFFTLYLQAAK